MRTRTPLSILAAGILAVTASAQSEDRKPVATEIESMRLQVENDGEKAYFHFSDAVKLTATNMVVECDSLEVFATREAEEQSNIGKFSAIKEIVATGNVRIVQEERTATCQKAIVKPNEERIILTGNPVVIQPGGRIVTYNPEDEILLDRGNGRISIIAKGPRRLRLTSSAIGDLGFETKEPIPTNSGHEIEGEEVPASFDSEEEETTDEAPADAEATDTDAEPKSDSE
ncbi:LptA/OstA family protein [Pelagicoccus sp. SDUM812002]|uniref:LptA/OstA family protein n=1 Tax=Pelagicoccus sp. SDUM812002 TaxID=3041266 RepID=UPI00280F9060|nr:LptA/OstA family protein [Pelagicoccus sp. SDUM812002]MDQ8185418.1 LptA/OstA family protein [Pelagicoccus sp. SDUM812002]